MSPPLPASCLPKRKGPDSSSLVTRMQEFIFQGAGGTRPRCSLRGLLGFTGNLDRVKEGNDNASGPLAVEISHRGARLVTLHWGREGCAWRGCETARVQRGSISRLKTLPVPACIFLSSIVVLPESCCVSILHQHTNLRFVKARWRIC